jgi:TFIIH basal transcription factor complex TTD-A subunit
VRVAGVLIECDPSIKSIIVNIDSDNHDYIIEDLDEERVVVKENMVAALKQKLEDVSDALPRCITVTTVPCNKPRFHTY